MLDQVSFADYAFLITQYGVLVQLNTKTNPVSVRSAPYSVPISKIGKKSVCRFPFGVRPSAEGRSTVTVTPPATASTVHQSDWTGRSNHHLQAGEKIFNEHSLIGEVSDSSAEPSFSFSLIQQNQRKSCLGFSSGSGQWLVGKWRFLRQREPMGWVVCRGARRIFDALGGRGCGQQLWWGFASSVLVEGARWRGVRTKPCAFLGKFQGRMGG
jgi:hypothetical protein